MALIFSNRPLEGLFYFIAFAALICSGFSGNMYAAHGKVHLGWLLILIVASWVEGLRGSQLFFAVFYLVYIVNFAVSTSWYTEPFEPYTLRNLLVWALVMACGLHNLHFVWTVGCNDFTLIESAKEGVAPYHVGVKKVRVTDKQIQASVYYPIDKTNKKVEFNSVWLENPNRTVKMMKYVFGESRGVSWIPDFILRTMT